MSDIQRSAVLSDDGLYRYRLDRWWGDGPRVAWVMLNPSTADADIDDPTLRRCIGFTRAWGYDGLTVVNLYPLRATDPSTIEMWLDGEATDEMGENTAAILLSATAAPLVMAAWGATRGDDGAAAMVFFQNYIARWHHLGLTKDGHPKHPLYVKGDTTPIPWNAIGPTEIGGMPEGVDSRSRAPDGGDQNPTGGATTTEEATQ